MNLYLIKKNSLRIFLQEVSDLYNKDVITMIQDGFYKVLAGFTTITEVLKLIELDDEIDDMKK